MSPRLRGAVVLLLFVASGCATHDGGGGSSDPSPPRAPRADDGPLRIDDDPVGMSVRAPEGRHPVRWTASFGARHLCAERPVTVTAVEPDWDAAPISASFLIDTLDAHEAEQERSDFYSALGAAPDFSERYATEEPLVSTTRAVGATVDHPCSASPSAVGRQELVVVLRVDEGGADLRRIDVTYEDEAGDRYVEHVRRWRMAVCGTHVPPHLCR
ncbi:hypothetical protein [Nocardioides sp. MH1]|uniref:hypothetical protein n=1 Tax=Nocardioides sp. MH1 TaxID=3242490 RepID=UPI0035209D36